MSKMRLLTRKLDNLNIPSTEPHTTLTIVSDITKNVLNKPAQETLIKKISLLQHRINVLTATRDTGIAKDDMHEEIKNYGKN